NTNIVTLKEEIEHVRNYLSIQKMRLGERLDYSIHINDDTEEVMCPFMSIQPFVENAINHAIEPNAAGGKVMITGEMENDVLMVRVIDDGKGMSSELIGKILDGNYDPESQGNENNTGIGIDNANKRLKYYYGPEFGIIINSEINNGTEVLIKIPRKALLGRGLNV
ncbi:MAG: ATP-binding protein, partial [Eubacterium sp.]